MSSTNNKPPGKFEQRNRKPKQQNKKSDQRQRPKPDQQPDRRQDEKELIEAEAPTAETFPIEAEAATAETFPIEAEAATAETFPIEAEASTSTSVIGAAIVSAQTPSTVSAPTPSARALVPMEASPTGTAVFADTFLTEFQTIANAYSDHIRKSLDLTRSFVEALVTVRSPEKAIEVQTEFAKQACETFLIDSQAIWRLYGELARQVLRPFERLVTRVTQAAR
jgi:hypothetical protein